MFTLPRADADALDDVYEAACGGGRPIPLWDAEQRYEPGVLARLLAAGLVRVRGRERVAVPTFQAAVLLSKPEVATVRSIFEALRNDVRTRGPRSVGIAEILTVTGLPLEDLERVLHVLPRLPGTGTVIVTSVGPRLPLQTTPELARWQPGRELSSPVAFPLLSLAAAAAWYTYGLREFVIHAPNQSFDGLDLRGSSIRDSNLSIAILPSLRLDDCVLERVDLRGAVARNASFCRTTFRSVTFLPQTLLESDLEEARFENGSASNIDQLTAEAKWSVIYLDGNPWYPSGFAPLVLEERPLGWAFILRGEDRGTIAVKGCAALWLLTQHPNQDIHVLDLEAAQAGFCPPDVGLVPTNIEVSKQLNELGLEEVERGGLHKKLADQERKRLAATLRRIALLDSGDEGTVPLKDEREALRDYVASKLGHDGGFPCDGPLQTIRKRVLSQFQTVASTVVGKDDDLGAAIERAFVMREFSTYSPARLEPAPQV